MPLRKMRKVIKRLFGQRKASSGKAALYTLTHFTHFITLITEFVTSLIK